MDQKYYDVTFIADRFVMTVTAGVPARDEGASAIDVARQIVIDGHGFDPEAYAYDVLVEVAF